MKKFRAYIISLSSFAIVAVSCSKQTDTFSSAELSAYMPVAVGKFIRYRLDSTRFIDFGQRDTVVSYDAKDVVEAQIADNAGRTGYRVVRYLRDILSTDEADYSPALTYQVVPELQSVELMENNLRFQKLRMPVSEGFNWHGNTFLPSAPYQQIYEFSNDADIATWNYTYQGVGQSAEVGGNVYDSTVTVLQVADSSNVPIVYPDGIAFKNYWLETYAQNIGLIYKEVIMWEYQPPSDGNPGFKSGFGLKMTITDHN